MRVPAAGATPRARSSSGRRRRNVLAVQGVTVAAAMRYPVKSLGGETVAAVNVGPRGLQGDRFGRPAPTTEGSAAVRRRAASGGSMVCRPFGRGWVTGMFRSSSSRTGTVIEPMIRARAGVSPTCSVLSSSYGRNRPCLIMMRHRFTSSSRRVSEPWRTRSESRSRRCGSGRISSWTSQGGRWPTGRGVEGISRSARRWSCALMSRCRGAGCSASRSPDSRADRACSRPSPPPME